MDSSRGLSALQADVDTAVVAPDGVRLHSMREIASNKICALLGRGEIRDLIDLRALLAHGLDLPSVLADAERKDRGVSAGTLAWILSATCGRNQG